MKTLIVLMALAGVLVASLLLVRAALAWREAHKKHEPVEYYSGWTGYRDPIRLEHKITKGEAEAIAAQGNAYLIGYFDTAGKLARVVKMYRGTMFFEYLYTYHANGKLKTAKITNPDGVVTVNDYDESGWKLEP